ncbi:hypothetical protein ACP70R_018082 [Stipagrostis hirtigluma subsp. patula]
MSDRSKAAAKGKDKGASYEVDHRLVAVVTILSDALEMPAGPSTPVPGLRGSQVAPLVYQAHKASAAAAATAEGLGTPVPPTTGNNGHASTTNYHQQPYKPPESISHMPLRPRGLFLASLLVHSVVPCATLSRAACGGPDFWPVNYLVSALIGSRNVPKSTYLVWLSFGSGNEPARFRLKPNSCALFRIPFLARPLSPFLVSGPFLSSPMESLQPGGAPKIWPPEGQPPIAAGRGGLPLRPAVAEDHRFGRASPSFRHSGGDVLWICNPGRGRIAAAVNSDLPCHGWHKSSE